jgi:hypothetical protein
MRFAALDGSPIDIYQAMTQLSDESGQTIPTHIATLLDNALGAKEYYAVITANMHNDYAVSPGHDAIVAAALSRGVPVITAKQLLDWVDARNTSTFSASDWDGSVLTVRFTTNAGRAMAMVPAVFGGKQLVAVTLNGQPVSTTTFVSKGVAYAAVRNAVSGTLLARYGT